MGVFEKLKNVFFEEEYVEVEEPVKKTKKEKQTIAKKVDLPEMPKIKEEKTAREKEIEEEVVERVEKKGISDNGLRRSFPMSFEDDDFVSDSYIEKQKEKEKRIEEKRKKEIIEENKIENKAYGGSYERGIYSTKNEEINTNSEYKIPYENKEYKTEQKVFRPTPIISPIYGILDKNYKKDEIVQKKEIRLSSASSKKVDLDSVREKAYGDLANDITESMLEEVDDKKNSKKVEVKDNFDNEGSLYDLNDTDHPVVSNVTMGDAEEYYKDLGLEYNVDYTDNKTERASGRRTERTIDKSPEDSLFDLIDSMYQDSEEE